MDEQRAGPGWYTDPTGTNDPQVQRYWDGSWWTGQRSWNGTQWVETAQGGPEPMSPPVAVPPKPRRRAWWIGGGAALAVVAVVVAVAVSSGDSSKGPGSVAARTSSPAAGSHRPVAGSANAMRTWEETKSDRSELTNGQTINTLEKDIATLGQDYAGQADDTTMFQDCNQISPQGDGSFFIPTDSPDASVNANLSKASDYLVSASTDCNVDDQAAAVELNKVIDYLNAAAGQIKALGG